MASVAAPRDGVPAVEIRRRPVARPRLTPHANAGVASVRTGADVAVDRERAEPVAAVESPRPGAEVLEAPTHLLPLRAVLVHRTPNSHTVGQRGNGRSVEQSVDHHCRQRSGSECVGAHDVVVEVRDARLALIPKRPSVTSAADQDPAAAVGGHVAIETFGAHDQARAQPVDAVLTRGVELLDLPA